MFYLDLDQPIRPAVPNLVPAGIFLPAKAFPNARDVLFGTKLIIWASFYD